MNPEKQAELDSIAAERGIPPPATDEPFKAANIEHEKASWLVQKHGAARAEFLDTILRAHVLQPDPGATDIFLKALDKYDGEAPDGEGQ